MPTKKRVDARRIRSAIAYTVPELARVVGVSEKTVRAWIKQGLPALEDKRPTLLIGAAVKDFLRKRGEARRRPLAQDQLFCAKCKAPRKPYGMMVDLIDRPGEPARIMGLCETCETPVSRVVSRSRIDEIEEIFDLALCIETAP